MTQDEMIEMAKQAGWQYAHGDSGYEPLWAFAELVAQHEREATAQMFDEAPPLVDFAKNDQGGCLICGFTPQLAAKAIRARGQA